MKRTVPPIPFAQISPNWLEGNPERLKSHDKVHLHIHQYGRGFRLRAPSRDQYLDLELTVADRLLIGLKPKVTEKDVLAFAATLIDTEKLALIKKIASK